MELELNEWLKADLLTGKGDVVEFLDEGEISEGEFDGKKVQQFSISVSLNEGPALKWTMNKTSQRAVASHYGNDTANWVGKTVELFVNKENVSGKMREVIYAVER